MNLDRINKRKPVSVDAAVREKRENPESLYLAGGMHFSHGFSGNAPRMLISLENLDLDLIQQGRKSLILGAGVSFYELSRLEGIPSILKEAASGLPSEEVSRKATIGGNIGAKRSDSLLIPALMALDSGIETVENLSRDVEEYVESAGQELIINVVISPSGGVACYKRVSREENGPAEVVVAVRIDGNGIDVSEARIILGGVFEKPVRLKELEERLVSGQIKGADKLQDAVNDFLFTEDDEKQMPYKKYIAGVVIADCVSRCMQALR